MTSPTPPRTSDPGYEPGSTTGPSDIHIPAPSPAEPEEAELSYEQASAMLDEHDVEFLFKDPDPASLAVRLAAESEDNAIAYRALARLLREREASQRSELGDDLCPGCGKSTMKKQGNVFCNDQYWHGVCYANRELRDAEEENLELIVSNGLSGPIYNPESEREIVDSCRDPSAAHIIPDAVSPSPPETAAELKKVELPPHWSPLPEPEPNSPGDLAGLLRGYLHDANVAVVEGNDLQAAKLIAAMDMISARCPTLASCDDMVDTLLAMGHDLRRRLEEGRVSVEIEPELQP